MSFPGSSKSQAFTLLMGKDKRPLYVPDTVLRGVLALCHEAAPVPSSCLVGNRTKVSGGSVVSPTCYKLLLQLSPSPNPSSSMKLPSLQGQRLDLAWCLGAWIVQMSLRKAKTSYLGGKHVINPANMDSAFLYSTDSSGVKNPNDEQKVKDGQDVEKLEYPYSG